MDLLEILNNILSTKNEIRDILGENDNIARYSVSIHNLLAAQYNAAYRLGFHDRYYELTGNDRWLAGPQNILEYDVNPKYYEAFTTDILTDIMKDVLNYRLNMKDELNEYIDPDIADNFKEYPDYLNGLLERIIEIGANDGIADADEAYDGNADVSIPTFEYAANRFQITSDQSEACIYFSLGQNGMPTIYSGPVIISEPVDVYYWARIGKSESAHEHASCSISADGNVAFVWPPTIYQENNTIYMSSSNNASIQYSIDGGEWHAYYGPVLVSQGMQEVKAFAVKNNEYSKYSVQPLSFEVDIDQYRPANVRCTIVDNGTTRTVTLSCATEAANIFYSIDEADGYYRNYSGPFDVEADHFLVYTYARKNGYESKQRLVYKWDRSVETDIPADVQFIDEGTAVTIYTTTSGAKVSYRFGPVGSFTDTNSNAVSVSPSNITDIYAYATLNGKRSLNESRYTYKPTGVTTKPPQPTMTQEGNVVLISSPYEVRYTMNQSDPRAYGIIYNAANGITITEFTTIKAVAILNGVYSNVATASFRYDDSSTGGESGSTGGGGYNPSNGTDTGEPFVEGNWFAVTGATGLTFSGSNVYFASEGDRTWKTVSSTSISGLNASVKTYFKGNINTISAFSGQATISGDISSIKGGIIGESDKSYDRMFANCTGLYNASGLIINISNMPERMMSGMFQNCTDLHEAAFDITASKVSSRGMENMFSGCSNLVGGPQFTFNEIGDYGMMRCFYGCSKLASAGSLELTSAGISALNGCFWGCTQLTQYSLSTPSGTAPNNVLNSMFYGCTALNDISRISLNYNTMGVSSFASMFYGCTALRSAMILNATTMAASCYAHMFEKSGIQTPPVINATTLANSCFDSMFRECTNLVSSPDLMVANIYGYTSCYANMFYGCSSLNHIKAMLNNNPSAGQYTANWVYGVAETGTFEVNKEADWPFSSGAYGPNAIPVGWTVVGAANVGTITSIWQQDGIVHIEASNSDEIWYCLTDEAITPVDSAFVKYTAPFQIYSQKYVWARCKNEDGVLGTVLMMPISPEYPKLTISYRSGKITIKTETDYEYDYISYQICEYQNTSNVIQDWTVYSAPFSIDTDRTIIAKGWVNSTAVTTTTYDVIYDITSPAIDFGILMNGDGTEIVRCWAYISYPNPDVLNSLWYKINDREEDNPETEPSKWTQGTQVELTSYLDATHDKVSVCAIANVNHNGDAVWSTMNTQEMHKGTTEQLSNPVFIQLSQSNNAILEYDGQQYYTWDDTDVIIEYKFEQGGEVKQYKQQINLADSGAYSAQTVNVYGRARVGNVRTEWNLSQLYYNPEYVHYDLNDPEINVQKDGDYIKVYITNPTVNPAYYTVQNYFKIVPVDYDATGLRPSGGPYDTYYEYNQPFAIDSHIVKFYVEAYSILHNDRSNTVTSKTYDIKTDFGIQWDNRPIPTIVVSSSDYTVTVTCPFDVEPLIKVVTGDDSWGTGTTDEHKYDTYKYATAIGLGKTGTGTYSGKLDTHLAKGTIYAKYEWEGIESAEASKAYTNASVQPLTAPNVSVSWSRNKQAYILKLSNTANDGVILKYRMENTRWAGGVVNTHKYDDLRVCGLYGDTLDQYLIEADIIGVTVYDPHGSNQTRESETYHFTNTHYTGLQVPDIFIVEKQNGNAVKVVNNNPAATNYWRLKSGTGVWNPSAIDTTKYDSWQLAFITDNDLDQYLLSGTFEAYSVWGDENTLDEIVEYTYDTGITIDDDPPTISVTADASGEFYNVTITNNAEMANFNNIIWKVDELVWSDVPEQNNMYTKYQGNTNGYWKLQNNAASYTFTIGQDLASGKIMAFASNAANTLYIYRSNNTPITTVEFTNELI